MPGRFNKAPLVYVTARIRTTDLPQLSSDQWAAIHQAMIKCGLVIAEHVDAHSVDLGQLMGQTGVHQGPESRKAFTTLPRKGFFNKNRTACLIIDNNAIEWRTSTYSKYRQFIDDFTAALKALVEAETVLGCLVSQEFILSYADVIVPAPGRTLSDYFSAADSALPLHFLRAKETSDILQVGLLQATRVTAPTKKITISLEQLPITDGKIPKWLPETLREPADNFTMPLNLPAEWTTVGSSEYALLMTQAAMLDDIEMKQLSIHSQFRQLHDLTRDAFRSLINRPICDIDWEYESVEENE